MEEVSGDNVNPLGLLWSFGAGGRSGSYCDARMCERVSGRGATAESFCLTRSGRHFRVSVRRTARHPLDGTPRSRLVSKTVESVPTSIAVRRNFHFDAVLLLRRRHLTDLISVAAMGRSLPAAASSDSDSEMIDAVERQRLASCVVDPAFLLQQSKQQQQQKQKMDRDSAVSEHGMTPSQPGIDGKMQFLSRKLAAILDNSITFVAASSDHEDGAGREGRRRRDLPPASTDSHGSVRLFTRSASHVVHLSVEDAMVAARATRQAAEDAELRQRRTRALAEPNSDEDGDDHQRKRKKKGRTVDEPTLKDFASIAAIVQQETGFGSLALPEQPKIKSEPAGESSARARKHKDKHKDKHKKKGKDN